jgi:Uma2 family endonuclease
MSAVALPAVAQPTHTPEEYLALERQAEHRSEYVNGHIYATTGASTAHNYIAGNIYTALRGRLRGRPCRSFIGDMRVKVAPTGMYTYPDVVALCGEPRLEDAHIDTLLNPAVIVEVLSPSTERYDRGEKFAHYRRLPSLQEYVLVAQDRARVEHYARQGEQWVLTALEGLEATLPLPALDCAIPLEDIYELVAPFSGEPPAR